MPASRRIEERTGTPPRDREEEEPIAEALAARNAADERTTPFVPPDDSLVLDTSTMNAEDVFQAVLDVVRERMDEGSGSARP